MKVLFLTNMYPHKRHPYFGIFVKEQFEYLHDHYDMDMDLFVLNGQSSLHKYLNPLVLYQKIKDFEPDIIHVHYGLTGLPLLLIAPFIKNKKIIATYHGSDVNGSKAVFFISKMLNKYADYNIAVSQQIFEKINQLSEKCVWIPCGIDDIFLDDQEPVERKNAVIFPGSPRRAVKNYPLFEEMMDVLKKKYGLTPEVILFDSKSRAEVKKSLKEAKCLVMTSLSEGSPQVIKEAIACDTPIVSTPVGDVPHLIENLDNCYIAQNAEDLAEKVACVFASEYHAFPEERKKRLSNVYVCDQIVGLYKELSDKDK